MTTVIGVRFRKVGRVYDFDPNELELKTGDAVIVETQKGLEYGECAGTAREIEDEQVVPPLRKVVRPATREDQEAVLRYEKKEEQAAEIFRKRSQAHQLVMKLVDVEYAFDGTRLVFYFTADGRVDFRDLVKDLASVFRMRIELRQVGVRDEAKMVGGLGICGRPFCCATFLSDFQPVSIKMAKEQSLSLNPAKISGTCGRLMCCLKYEQEAYEDLLATTPKPGALVQTKQGQGTVTDVSLLRGMLNIRLEDAPEAPQPYHKSEVHVIKAPRREYGVQADTGAAAEELKGLEDTPEPEGAPGKAPNRRRGNHGNPHHKGSEPKSGDARPADGGTKPVTSKSGGNKSAIRPSGREPSGREPSGRGPSGRGPSGRGPSNPGKLP